MDFTQHSPSSFAVSPVAEGVQCTSLTRSIRMDGDHCSGSARLWASLVSTSTDINTPPSSTCTPDQAPARCWWMKFRMFTELGRQPTLICASRQGKMEVKKEKKGSSASSAGNKGSFCLGWKSDENTNTVKPADIQRVNILSAQNRDEVFEWIEARRGHSLVPISNFAELQI